MRIEIINLQGLDNQQHTSVMEKVGMSPVEVAGNFTAASGYIIYSDLTDPLLINGLIEQSAQGKPILGIGGGAVFLVKAGLVPGVEGNKPAISWLKSAVDHSHIRLSSQCRLMVKLFLFPQVYSWRYKKMA
jgi:hypothetical protein